MAGAPHRGRRRAGAVASSAATLLPLLLAAGARATATEWVAEGGALQGRHLPPSSLEGRGGTEARATAVHVPSAFDGPDSEADGPEVLVYPGPVAGRFFGPSRPKNAAGPAGRPTAAGESPESAPQDHWSSGQGEQLLPENGRAAGGRARDNAAD